MKQRKLRIVQTGLALLLFSTPVMAKDSRVKALERQLAERDTVILELLQRVGALEQRVGVAPPQAAPKNTAGLVRAKQKSNPEAETVAAPGSVIVTEEQAERALERSLASEGALLLRPGILEIEPSMIFARQENATSSFVASGDGTVASQTERNINQFTADVGLRLGLPWDSQLEIGLPYRWNDVETVTNVGFAPIGSSSNSSSGFGDIRLGFAKTLLREGLWTPDLVGRITWDSNSGDNDDNGISLGSGFHEITGSLTAIKRQDPIVFIGGVSYQHSFEDSDLQPGGLYAANLGGAIALSPETSLRFALTGAYQEEFELSGNQVAGSDRTFASFVIGGSTLLAPGVLLNTSLGIGLTEDADDLSLLFSLPIRFNSPVF
jgi:hypothetical protein